MKIKFLLFSLNFIVTASMLSSCLSLTTMQSGRTIGKDNIEANLNGTYGKYSEISVLDKEGDFDNKPVFGLKTRYGVTEKLDIGISADQTSLIGPSMKYQYCGNKHSLFASSVGLDLGLYFGAVFLGNLTYYVAIPLYLSVHPNNRLSIYFTPRYIHASEYIYDSPSGGQEGTISHINKAGSSYGIIFGENHKIILEIANYGKRVYSPTQISVGCSFLLNNKAKNH